MWQMCCREGHPSAYMHMYICMGMRERLHHMHMRMHMCMCLCLYKTYMAHMHDVLQGAPPTLLGTRSGERLYSSRTNPSPQGLAAEDYAVRRLSSRLSNSSSELSHSPNGRGGEDGSTPAGGTALSSAVRVLGSATDSSAPSVNTAANDALDDLTPASAHFAAASFGGVLRAKSRKHAPCRDAPMLAGASATHATGTSSVVSVDPAAPAAAPAAAGAVVGAEAPPEMSSMSNTGLDYSSSRATGTRQLQPTPSRPRDQGVTPDQGVSSRSVIWHAPDTLLHLAGVRRALEVHDGRLIISRIEAAQLNRQGSFVSKSR